MELGSGLGRPGDGVLGVAGPSRAVGPVDREVSSAALRVRTDQVANALRTVAGFHRWGGRGSIVACVIPRTLLGRATTGRFSECDRRCLVVLNMHTRKLCHCRNLLLRGRVARHRLGHAGRQGTVT